ncbi:kynurenine formamidase isoform X1 [Neodiprion lecontei]|uniref:Kynurenine formamidase isoform X1 n=1 Tax=Neodiprion lecontei TaxID=441921 RepID=A0ABM3FPL6_NEOLC|nr:kynurenine formamidase isoform X1 [Neodiprion lecontei]XP_046589960.1 kynurenine formamidase isoform X1 [Neodiprion lecontei]XP_046589961.1 kynurenine formamidase isoform X1 [Neodiprion lecontei]XP_046589962.1 kynurenine formamidase isoform X1 [Neodiprion lecontei]XP_046589963.1 kynurenine formamidase isoform X1 [Neodiprion lecontei]XP_046589964.1 kynurenine formamidase isoform X1 [Neodiprion lecontei]XP_046589965.1 kynurenine formamidase isoform X1 [Neodiprion lecontei]XP_046589966.1 kyn
MDNVDQETLFSPSMWNKRTSPEKVVTNFLKLGEEVTIRARENTKCKLDVPYGPSVKTKYDVYGIDLPNDAPIFVFIHGGYWQETSKNVIAFPVENCVSEGIKVICVGYDLCPNVQLRDIVLQIKSATHQILHSAAKSGSRGVWVGGHSAGAHLSASLLEPKWLVDEPNSTLLKGLVLLSGIYFLEPLLTTSYNDQLKLDSKEARFMSALSVLHAPVPNLKAMVVVGECDSPEFIEQARQLTKQLCSYMDNVEYILLRDSIDHYSMLENLTISDFPLTKRIVKLIKGTFD